MRTPWRRRREARLLALERFRAARRLTDEDVTVLGEQLAQLHLDTLTASLDAAGEADYRHALGGYEQAKLRLREATEAQDAEAVLAVVPLLEDARFHRACVLARVGGDPLPTRRDPCFFNPLHGPAVTDVDWAPPAGTTREVPVCIACRDRLSTDRAPDVRQVRVGDRWVGWWEASGSAREGAGSAHLVHGTSWAHTAALAEASARASAARFNGGYWSG